MTDRPVGQKVLRNVVDMAGRPVGQKLLRNTEYGVVVRGTTVVLQIRGQDALVLDWVTAVRMAHFLRHGSRIAKANAGLSGIAVPVAGFADLTDANLDELEAQKSRDGTAVFSRVR